MFARGINTQRPWERRGRRRWRELAALAAIGACAGCWEEIHYVPAPEATVIDAEPVDDDQPPAVAPMNEPAARPTLTEPPPIVESPPPEVTLPPPAPDAAPAVAVETPAPEPAPPAESAPPAATSAERRLAWTAASTWSLGAAMAAKGLEPARYEPVLEEASDAAAAIGVELPPLPAADRAAELEAAVVRSLTDDAGPALASLLGERFGPPEQAAAELAIRSHGWLLSYSPRLAEGAAQAAAVRQLGAASGLPAELWEPLAALLAEQAEFVPVRQAIFDMHRGVDGHLREAAGE